MRTSKESYQMRIAYIGSRRGTSLQRAGALGRIGHQVTVIDPRNFLPPSKWVDRWLYHAGGMGVSRFIDPPILDRVRRIRPDLIWVAQGEYLGCALLRKLHQLCAGPIINYMDDDPFGGRDGRRFRNYLKAAGQYDLLVVVRSENVLEAQRAGARRVLHIFRSADEEAHLPRVLSADDRRRFSSEVAFVGTWMPERGPFLCELIRLGVPLAIWGGRWHKAIQWHKLRPYWRGPGLEDADEYAKAIQGAKVNLGLLSKGNRDLHTFRSMEIPALGGVLCTQRTVEHQLLYKEDVEAVFWSGAAECAAKCLSLLADPRRRAAIARAGRARLLRNRNYNETVMAKILDTALRS
jgi:spore maturation protein CgeB